MWDRPNGSFQIESPRTNEEFLRLEAHLRGQTFTKRNVVLDLWFTRIVGISITFILEITLLSIPEVRADKVRERPGLDIQNLLHLSTNHGGLSPAQWLSVD